MISAINSPLNKTSITIKLVNEFAIEEKVKAEIAELLPICFTDTNYNGRTYFKQLPHSRLIMKSNDKTIGQVGMDYRAMNLNGKIIHVLGVIDLAVHPDYRGLGLGADLMHEMARIAESHKDNIDFIFLVTGQSLFYEKLGYQHTNPKTNWLKIHQGKNYGMAHQQIDDSDMMYKKISDKEWEEGELDMMGYMY